ncbi:putative dipeptide-transport integral membrane protein ABC transporter DppB [Streptosporangium violaceochromogenes]|nr:putative dipeptide-transport integral membrane protein ABC transporter DppB [Streptosporangium violaceochromogenes]
MRRYITMRLIALVLTFLGVTLLIYVLVYALPGDPIRGMAGDRPLPEGVIAELRARYHLDEPFPVQYWYYVQGVLRGDLGTDFNGRPVAELMADRWPVTLTLALTAWVLELVAGLALGVLSALRRNRVLDRVVMILTIVAISVPIFVIAYTAQLVLGVHMRWLPISGIAEGWPRSYLLPAVVLATFGIASVSRLVRTSLIENLDADYIRTARGKGLPSRKVVTRHALRNSLIPAVTYLGADLGFLLGGTLIVEGVFNLPGIGQLLFASIQQQQGPVVVGVATLLVLTFLVANLVVDLLYGVLDPRISHVRR